MKRFLLSLSICALCFGCQSTIDTPNVHSTSSQKIGVYDSRAIAIAFVGSEVYKQTIGRELDEKMEEMRRAQASGNTRRIEELNAWGKSQQARMHQQGFSTAPVDDILDHIDDKLPAILRSSGVAELISKWDSKSLANYNSSQFVDVTMLLVSAFQPSDKQFRSAIDIQKQIPVSSDQLN